MDDASPKRSNENWEQFIERLLTEMKDRHPSQESYSEQERHLLRNSEVYGPVIKYRSRKGDMGGLSYKGDMLGLSTVDQLDYPTRLGPRGGRYTVRISGRSGRAYRSYY